MSKGEFLVATGYYLVCAGLTLFLLRFLFPLLWPMLCGMLLAYFFRHFAKRCGFHTKFSLIITAILWYGVVVLLVWGGILFLIGAVSRWGEQLPSFYAEQLSPLLSAGTSAIRIGAWDTTAFLPGLRFFAELLSQFAARCSAGMLTLLQRFLGKLPLFLIGFLFLLMSSFAILLDYDHIMAFLFRQFPAALRPKLLACRTFCTTTVFRLARAYGTILVVTFLELWVGLFALRVSGAWKIAAGIALLDLLPVLGSGLVLIPWGILQLLMGHKALGIGLLLLYGVITVVRNLIEPQILGEELGLPWIITLTAMFLGLRLFGIIGMMGMPLLVLFFRFLQQEKVLRWYRE